MIQPINSNITITLNSPGKVNLHLAVGKKREDGFHELNSIFAALDFADSLAFSLLPGNEARTTINIRNEGPLSELLQKGQLFPHFPVKNNIIYQAAGLFRQKTGFSTNLRIELIKRIPPGSGLGGGSSNAATTLLAMNELSSPSGIKLSREEMLDMAAKLGSDVPFFVEIALQRSKKSSARIVNGRGEFFSYVPPPPPLGVLLAFPGFISHTGDAYRLLDENRPVVSKMDSIESKDFSWASPENWNFSNDFQHIFTKYNSDRNSRTYVTILKSLKKAGAVFTSLSGSGSACFGLFSSPEKAMQAEKNIYEILFEPKPDILAFKSTFFLPSD
ncbi:MAG: 4-(cytidine 5'-diphospho)-2-C-methyl-D-erythritol kinase [Treponema sp.]|nr:4-(cytidine 5'-diphospho)-2-C-methyl-D-erythritol kinase [Treponema sp.]